MYESEKNDKGLGEVIRVSEEQNWAWGNRNKPMEAKGSKKPLDVTLNCVEKDGGASYKDYEWHGDAVGNSIYVDTSTKMCMHINKHRHTNTT